MSKTLIFLLLSTILFSCTQNNTIVMPTASIPSNGTGHFEIIFSSVSKESELVLHSPSYSVQEVQPAEQVVIDGSLITFSIDSIDYQSNNNLYIYKCKGTYPTYPTPTGKTLKYQLGIQRYNSSTNASEAIIGFHRDNLTPGDTVKF